MKPFQSLTLVLPPQCQRIWLLDPVYLWTHYNPQLFLMDYTDYTESKIRSRNSPYDYAIFLAIEKLRKSDFLWVYSSNNVLGPSMISKIKIESRSILKIILSQGS